MSRVTGPLQHPWTLSKTQSHTRLQKGSRGRRFFFFFSLLFTKTYLIYFWPSQQPLAPPPEPCSMTPTRVTLPSLLFFFPCLIQPPPATHPLSSFSTAAVENQTALKQIDVRFNTVVTSSQGPRASASVTTAGLPSLALAAAATLLVASMIYRSKKRKRRVG